MSWNENHFISKLMTERTNCATWQTCLWMIWIEWSFEDLKRYFSEVWESTTLSFRIMGGCVGRYIANVWDLRRRTSKNKYEFDHRMDANKVHRNIRPRDQERRTGDRRNRDHGIGDRRTKNHKGDDQEPVRLEIPLEDPDKERRIGNYMDNQDTITNNNHQHLPTVTEL